jgi:hypothetical protein
MRLIIGGPKAEAAPPGAQAMRWGRGTGMPKIAAVTGIAVAVAMLASAVSAPAQQAQTTLPELTVTAPSAKPEWAAPRSGMLGKVRVEEEQWREIPCDSSRMNAAAGKCQEGPKVMSALSYMASGERPNAYGDCTIVHPLTRAVIGRFAVEADVLVFDPYKVTAAVQINNKCTVWSGYEHLPDDFKDMNQVARRGVAWQNFVPGNGQAGAQSTMEFADGRNSCLALERLGPRWQAGFVWVMHATLCQAGTMPISQTDIDAVAGALQIHVYDPVGNLAAPR